VVNDFEMSTHLQRLLKEAGQSAPGIKPILEVNPTHPLVMRFRDDKDSERFSDWAQLLFEQALLSEGGHLEDPASFVGRLNKLLVELSAILKMRT
jgi:molecular chaperone HtpG